MEFTLQNPPPKYPRLKIDAVPTRQRLLLSGLDCLPGQQDLFEGIDDAAMNRRPSQSKLTLDEKQLLDDAGATDVARKILLRAAGRQVK